MKYAFIIDNKDNKEYYTYRKLLADGVDKLFENEEVQFELQETAKGIHAINVKPVK